uniref:Thioredoxin n=1 Tax=Marseillevirus LCMAC201 TaxID=2506605 RepID=A0A481YWK3_9VIRU|nr:MAG: thioredoxin [Marseillevirus LCMAC201]
MDFLDSMDNTQKIVLGIAVVTLVIAVVYFFCKKKDERMVAVNQPEPKQEEAQPQKLDEEDKVLVMFFAPWCGHCQNMSPAWDEFTQNFDGYNGIKILKINGEENQQLSQLHDIKGFPVIKYCPKGLQNPEGIMYEGDRSVNSLAQFLQQNA